MHIVDAAPTPPTWLRFVPKCEVPAFEARGWTKRRGLSGTHHGVHAVLMEWTGNGEPPR